VPLFCRVSGAVKDELELAAHVSGKGEGEVLRDLLTEALAARAAHARAPDLAQHEALFARLDELEKRLDDVGISTRSAVRLLAHWATQAGAVRVSEDELLAELRAVGRDEWQQAVEELDDLRAGIEDTRGRVGKVLE
jgi:hypothetical protein